MVETVVREGHRPGVGRNQGHLELHLPGTEPGLGHHARCEIERRHLSGCQEMREVLAGPAGDVQHSTPGSREVPPSKPVDEE